MGHRSSLVQRNKPFKGSPNKSSKDKKSSVVKVRTIEGKQARRQHANAIRANKIAKAKESAGTARQKMLHPRLVAFLPLHSSVDMTFLAKQVLAFIFHDMVKNRFLDQETAHELFVKAVNLAVNTQCVLIPLPAWAGKSGWLQMVFAKNCSDEDPSLPQRVIETLDICKVADVVVPVYGNISVNDAGFGTYGNELISLLQKQGLPAVTGIAVASDFELVLRSFATSFGRESKAFDLSTSIKADYETAKSKDVGSLINFFRHLVTMPLTTLSWREPQRGYGIVNVEDIIEGDDGHINLRCFVHGAGVSVKSPLHITGVGDFALVQVSVIPLKGKELHPAEPQVIDQLTDFEAYKRGWKSTNDDVSYTLDQAEDMEAFEDEDAESESSTDIDDEEGDVSEMGSDNDCDSNFNWGDQDENIVGNLQPRRRVDMELEDEVDTPNDQPARERFAKYRGLKSFKNSNWDTLAQDEIPYANRLFKMRPYRNIVKGVAQHYLNTLKQTVEKADCVTKGCKGRLFVLTLAPRLPGDDTEEQGVVEARLRSRIQEGLPLVFSTMTFLERKISIQHFSMTRFGDTVDVPIPTKSELLIQCGFRRHLFKPLFSTPAGSARKEIPIESKNLSNEKLASHRYLKNSAKETGIYSGVGPSHNFQSPALSWFVNCPTNKEEEVAEFVEGKVEAIAQADMDNVDSDNLRRLLAPKKGMCLSYGRFVTTDPDRLVIKRIVLTGYPHKISGRRATVTRMFMNRADVEYFQPIDLFTKRNKIGKITEALGMHGSMKCLFSEPVEHGETICLALYKRHIPPFYEQALNGCPM